MAHNKKTKTDPASTVSSFSKNLLGLKFMQRARQEAEKVAKEKREQELDSPSIFQVNTKQKFVTHLTYQFCENLKFGRFSFNGMNEDIEALMYRNDPNSVSVQTPQSAKRHAPPSDTSSDNEMNNPDSDDDDNDVSLEDNSILG